MITKITLPILVVLSIWFTLWCFANIEPDETQQEQRVIYLFSDEEVYGIKY